MCDDYGMTGLPAISWESLLAPAVDALARCPDDPDDLIALLRSWQLEPEVVKGPRWAYDSLIVRVRCSVGELPLLRDTAIKVHGDLFPLAAHLYEALELRDAVGRSGVATFVHESLVVECGGTFGPLPQRVTVFDMIDGAPLGTLLADRATDCAHLRNLLRRSVSRLLEVGVHPLLRDLDDFVLTTDDQGVQTLVVTDYNCLLDCSKAPSSARAGAMELIDHVIETLVTPQYRPYRGTVRR